MVEKILELMKSSLKPEILNQAKNEIQNQFLDSSKAATRLKWKPEFTLEQGLAETIDWYKELFHTGQANEKA